MYEFDWSSIPGALPLLGKGLLVTLEVTLTAIVVGIVWGTLLAVARLGANPLLAGLAAGYVNLFRSVPLVMVIHENNAMQYSHLEYQFFTNGLPTSSEQCLGTKTALCM